jgi:hypothetical protein
MACGQVTAVNSQTLCHAARAGESAAQVVDFQGFTCIKQRVLEGIFNACISFVFHF